MQNKDDKAAKIKLWTWLGGHRSHRGSTLKVQKGENIKIWSTTTHGHICEGCKGCKAEMD